MKRRRKGSTPVFGWFLFGLSSASVLVTFWLLVSGLQYLREEFPNPAVLRTQYPWVVYQGPGKPPLVRLRKERPPQWVALPNISNVAVGAVVVSEDWAFFQHGGYDAKQIREAIKEDLEEGKFSRGASTITQQVAKNVFLERDKNIWRKVKEFYLAVQMEKSLGKRKILEVYLNIAEWGEGIYGINQASQRYFGKPPSALTAKEGAFLAMLLPSPVRYSQSFRSRELTRYARRTVRSILDKMTQARYITSEELEREERVPLAFEESKGFDSDRPFGDNED